MDFEEIEALLFDMDGVLIDSMKYHAKSFVKALNEFDVKIKEDSIYRWEGKGDIHIIKEILKQKNLQEIDPKNIAEERRKIFGEIEETKPFEGMYELLNELTKKHRLSVVSGSTRKNLNNFITRFYPSIFNCLVSGEDIQNQKPHPEPFQKCLKGVNAKEDEAIVIENAPLGVESAKKAGIKCIAVATYVEPEELLKADVVLENHEKLKDYLRQNLL